MSAAESYQFAFRVGLVGSILLLLIAVLWRPVAAAIGIVVWIVVTLFVLPWLYVCYQKNGLRIPPWLLKGPHQ